MTQPLGPHQVIAQRIRELRTRHGWSAQRLAEEMTAVGFPWDRSIVANVENGRRSGVSVEEMLSLAYVLDVAPVHLIVPIDSGVDADLELYPVTPAVAVSRHTVRDWIRGLEPLPEQDRRAFLSERPLEEFGSQAEAKATRRHREVDDAG